METDPKRGDVYLAHFGRTDGHEQGGKRPCLIVSATLHNRNAYGLTVVLPLTTRTWELPWHLRIDPPEGGLDRESYVMCDQIRTVAQSRLLNRFGRVEEETLRAVEDRLRMLLDL